jgi:hypothetical protein
MGQEITLGIRPECIILGNEPGANTIACKIVRVIEGISGCFCEFAPAGSTKEGYSFFVEIPKINTPAFQPGQECYLYLPSERIAIMAD